jgi:hypothetical protein
MSHLQGLAHESGKAVVAAIHQPRSAIWSLFDKVRHTTGSRYYEKYCERYRAIYCARYCARLCGRYCRSLSVVLLELLFVKEGWYTRYLLSVRRQS